jgi:hypothetical protein
VAEEEDFSLGSRPSQYTWEEETLSRLGEYAVALELAGDLN